MQANYIRSAIRALGIGAALFMPASGMVHADSTTIFGTGPNSTTGVTGTTTNSWTNVANLNATLANIFGLNLNLLGDTVANNTTVLGLNSGDAPVTVGVHFDNAGNNSGAGAGTGVMAWPASSPNTTSIAVTGPNSSTGVANSTTNSATNVVTKTDNVSNTAAVNITKQGDTIANNTLVSGGGSAGAGITLDVGMDNSFNNGPVSPMVSGFGAGSGGGNTTTIAQTGPFSATNVSNATTNSATSVVSLSSTISNTGNFNIVDGGDTIVGNTTVANVQASAPINVHYDVSNGVNNSTL